MAGGAGRYPPEYKEEMVELWRGGRSVQSLAAGAGRHGVYGDAIP